MHKTITALGIAAGLGLLCCEAAGAFPTNASAMAQAAGSSALQQVQYAERHTRHGIVKCYREFVVGPYRCHRYRYW